MSIILFFSCEVSKHVWSKTIKQVLNTAVLEIATKEVSTIDPQADVGQAAKIMQHKNIGATPVVENAKLVGIITVRDFFKIME
jgi:CBS domain-containing protein